MNVQCQGFFAFVIFSTLKNYMLHGSHYPAVTELTFIKVTYDPKSVTSYIAGSYLYPSTYNPITGMLNYMIRISQ
jgi:hypothetical protein